MKNIEVEVKRNIKKMPALFLVLRLRKKLISYKKTCIFLERGQFPKDGCPFCLD